MIITVTYENGDVYGHFGHTENFKIYKVKDGIVEESRIADNAGLSHGGLVPLIKSFGTDILFCGGIGSHAINLLENEGIKVFAGVSGDADKNVNDFLDGHLTFNQGAVHECSHEHGDHDHEHHHH